MTENEKTDNVLHCAIIERDGRKALFYIEPDGDDFVVHSIGRVPGLGQADITERFTRVPGTVQAHLWERVSEDGFRVYFDKFWAAVDSLASGLTDPDPEATNPRT